MRFVAVGELLVDVVASGTGHDARIRVRPGGSAYNAANVAAQLGAQTSVFGAVGNDPGGDLVLGALRSRGVDATDVREVAGDTGTFLVTDGEVRVDRGVSRDVVLPHALAGDVVLVSGYLPRETIEEALALARGTWVALDAARIEQLPRGGNAVLANEEAARRLTGHDPEDAARSLAADYRLACVTCGPSGAVAVMGARVETVEPPGRVDLERPGTGDAFAAALLVQLAAGADLASGLAEAARWGAAATSWK